MESNFNNRDFERFVKQNADQYRMFPSEKVWKGIHSALHTRRRWYGIALALLLITTGVVTGVMLMPGSNNDKTITSLATIQATQPSATISTKAGTEEKQQQKAIRIPSTIVSADMDKRSEDDVFNTSLFTASEDQTLINENNNTVADVNVVETTTNNSPSYPVAIKNKEEKFVADEQPELAKNQITTNKSPLTKADGPIASASAEISNEKTVQDKKKNTDDDETKLPKITDRVSKSVIQTGRKKLSWQLYVTPTVSYRTLTENIDFIAAVRYNNYVNAVGGGTGFYNTDVNTVVNHKPDLGFQVGVRAAYPLSKWLSLTGGLQLSVSKYDIKAYQHPAEVATIALTDRSIFSMSNYRNTNGYDENWLRNFYFSASLPVGLELKLSEGNKNFFGVAGTIQPTYVLDNRAYVISADYKNYAELPSLIRHVNMNTSFEVFAQQTTGKLKWRVGPQVRYQAMSSFVKNYPIKEHLFDFGLKLGIQLK